MSGSYVGHTIHGNKRARKRAYTEQDIENAIESAKASGQVVTQIGKYGTPQTVYHGANGLTAVIETAGRNANKLITGWWRDE